MLFSVLCLLCLCVRLFICALWSPAGKGLTSVWCITVSLSLSHWYPGSGEVLGCVDSRFLHPYLLYLYMHEALYDYELCNRCSVPSYICITHTEHCI